MPLGVPVTTAARLAGFDLCFSAPKSVSVAWALAPPSMADRIAAAHDRAVTDAVAALEAEAVRARRGAGGRRIVATDGVVAAGFGHRTSRAGDPQIHTHVVVANLTVDSTGRWSAIDGAQVYRWAKTLGYLYQAALRHHLRADLGLEWGPVRSGAADLAGIDPAALDAFSKRRDQINTALGGHLDQVPLPVAKAAVLATRAAKADLPDLHQLRTRWQEEAAATGLVPATVAGLAGPLRPFPDALDPAVDRLLDADGLTAHASSFDRRAILQALAEASPQGCPAAELRRAADQLVTREEVVALEPDRSGPRWSTADLLSVEAGLVAGAARRRTARVGLVPADRLEAALDGRTLSAEQTAMVRSLTSSGAGVEVVVGRAGAGKTYALDAARAAWQAGGHPVIGTALAARAAAELQAGAGIPSTTVDRLLADLDRPGPLSALGPRTCIVVDEAGMVGSRKLARLLDHADRAGAKVVLVGDPRQLPEIEAGGALSALARTVPTTELADNHRQAQAWERAALAELRAGDVPAAFAAYRGAGRVTLAADTDAARRAMVDDWWTAHTGGADAVMYALRRSDVEDLNRRARAHLDAAGRLGPDRLDAAGREYAAGDRVICLRNDRRLGVRNGTVSTVTGVDLGRGRVTLADGIVLPGDYLTAGHLGHAYATTIHKAQGATVDRAFLLGSAHLYREAGYVGLSRARHGSDLYIVAPAGGPGADQAVDPVAQTIRRLSTSQAQALASDQLPGRPSSPDRSITGPGLPHPGRVPAVLADPEPWMLETLGPPPVTGPGRERWARTAERLAAYRDIWAVTDPAEPLGPRPDDPDQRRAWHLARLALDDYDRLDPRQIDRRLEPEGLQL